MKSERRKIEVVLVFAVLFTTLAFVSVGCASATEWHVYPGQSIQTAINNAGVGDIIYVHAGTYTENVVVNKSLTLEGVGMPEINGRNLLHEYDLLLNDPSGDATFDIGRIWIEKGVDLWWVPEPKLVFPVEYYAARDFLRIYMDTDNNPATGYSIHDIGADYRKNTRGIESWQGERWQFLNGWSVTGYTDCRNCPEGADIRYFFDFDDAVTGFRLTNATAIRLVFESLDRSTSPVTVDDVAPDSGSVQLDVQRWKDEPVDPPVAITVQSDDCIIEGFKLTESDKCGLLIHSNNSRISNNTISDNEMGLLLESSNNNIIDNNTIVSNEWDGIYIEDSTSNIVKNNNVTNNEAGVWLSSSSNNLIYNNYFDNTQNAGDDDNNIWNTAKTPGTNIVGGPFLGGNYWSDYTGEDLDGDGLGDTPYIISGGAAQDNYPLMPWEGELLPVANFTANVTSGTVPLTVQFTDTSTSNPTSWSWDFGDGGTSTEQNPTYTYTDEGSYTVSLTVSNDYGSDTKTKTDYITVNPEPQVFKKYFGLVKKGEKVTIELIIGNDQEDNYIIESIVIDKPFITVSQDVSYPIIIEPESNVIIPLIIDTAELFGKVSEIITISFYTNDQKIGVDVLKLKMEGFVVSDYGTGEGPLRINDFYTEDEMINGELYRIISISIENSAPYFTFVPAETRDDEPNIIITGLQGASEPTIKVGSSIHYGRFLTVKEMYQDNEQYIPYIKFVFCPIPTSPGDAITQIIEVAAPMVLPDSVNIDPIHHYFDFIDWAWTHDAKDTTLIFNDWFLNAVDPLTVLGGFGYEGNMYPYYEGITGIGRTGGWVAGDIQQKNWKIANRPGWGYWPPMYDNSPSKNSWYNYRSTYGLPKKEPGFILPPNSRLVVEIPCGPFDPLTPIEIEDVIDESQFKLGIMEYQALETLAAEPLYNDPVDLKDELIVSLIEPYWPYGGMQSEMICTLSCIYNGNWEGTPVESRKGLEFEGTAFNYYSFYAESDEITSGRTLFIGLFSPIEISISDSNGNIVNKDVNTIPGASYFEMDIDEDGSNEKFISIQDYEFGNYEIRLSPEAGADPNDTYSLKVSASGKTVVLAEDVPISEIPDQPYIIRSTEEGIFVIPPTIQDTIRIEPETLNLASKGVFTAFIPLPEGYNVSDINISSVECECASAIEGVIVQGGEGSHQGKGHIGDTLKVKFNRQDLVNVPTGDAVTLTVTGKHYDGTPFEGSDTIRVIDEE